MQFRAVKGMNDILPDEAPRWQRLERLFRQTAELYGYGEVRTPIVEPTSLFVRSIGDTTDIVEKEMYSFSHHEDELTLRPEGTAGAARAYVEHKQHAKEPVSRWYYLGPMFRAERPQRGRYRQFYQAGCEIFGDPGPGCDAEMIDMLVGMFRKLGVADVTAHVNSIGGPGTRERYRAALARVSRAPSRIRLPITPGVASSPIHFAFWTRRIPQIRPRARVRRASSTCSTTRIAPTGTACAESSMPWERLTPSIRCWFVASTTTRAPCSSFAPHRESSAPRTPCAAAGATTT